MKLQLNEKPVELGQAPIRLSLPVKLDGSVFKGPRSSLNYLIFLFFVSLSTN